MSDLAGACRSRCATAATEQRFLLMTQEMRYLYQRFAFLRSLIANDGFRAAMKLSSARTYRGSKFRRVRPGRGKERRLGATDAVRRSPWPAGQLLQSFKAIVLKQRLLSTLHQIVL
jgi:hypothetical protein